MFAGSFSKCGEMRHTVRVILDFHLCREGSSVNSEKRGVDEFYVYWQCTSLDLMFSRQVEKLGVNPYVA